jgi:hypothetical protein
LALETIPQAAPAAAPEVTEADFVCGIATGYDPESTPAIRESLRGLKGAKRIVVFQDVAAPSDAEAGMVASPDGSAAITFLPWPANLDGSTAPLQGLLGAYQTVFSACQKLNARGCCLIASHLEGATPNWVGDMARPILESEFDLALPGYARRKLEGLLNNSIISPLTRCLYGKRVQNPLGPDLGVSRRLVDRMVLRDRNAAGSNGAPHPLASLSPVALSESFKTCQVNLGARVYPPTDWTNLSALVSQVLSPVFLEVEKNAPFWQRVRGSTALAGFGSPMRVLHEETGAVDISRLVESFQLGTRDLQEIWGIVLPPATLLELRRLSRATPEAFRLPDELWVRIIYDFALGHRLRTINRDHLLRSLTPLYLGWVASLARELENSGAGGVEQRLEKLALAYEEAKPYLLSRWRWPDRFNP